MSRQTWMDRTIETARATDIVLPWLRRPAPEGERLPEPVRATNRVSG